MYRCVSLCTRDPLAAGAGMRPASNHFSAPALVWELCWEKNGWKTMPIDRVDQGHSLRPDKAWACLNQQGG